MRKQLIILAVVGASLVFSSCSRAPIEDQPVPIEIGYERVEITNLQHTENGTYVYVLTDTATNREYLYVLRESGVPGRIGYQCASSMVEIGEWVEPKATNSETENLINRNELSHTGGNHAYVNGEKVS